MTILDKTKELGQMIIQSEEYINLEKAEIVQNNDPVAMDLIAEYNVHRNEFMTEMRDENITPEKMESIRANMQVEFEKLSSNQAIAQYLQATQNFQQLMNQVNGIISHFVNGEQSGCSSDGCSSCSGCH